VVRKIKSVGWIWLLLVSRVLAQIADNPMGDRGVAYTMSFQVIDRASQPVKNAIVDVYSFSGSRLMGAMTSSEGRVMFRMTPGTYVITVKGNDIEDAKTDFRVERYDGDRFEQIAVNRTPRNHETAPSGVITAAMAAIPEKARSEVAKGEAKLLQKDYTQAKEHFKKATRMYPSYAGAFNGIGVVELRLKNIAAAEAAFQQAITADDQHPTGYLNLGKLYILQRDAAKALPFLQKTTTLDPRNLEALAQLSFAQFATGDCKAALATAARVHSGPHKQGELAHLVAGTCHEAAGDAEKARSEYELYLSEAPQGPQAAQARTALERLRAPK
jgi:tetratricopeptide (TPR) repeat protein